jgi:hypothetical protein
MISGTLTISASDDDRFVVGSQIVLNIDSSVELDVVTTTSVTATVPAGDTVTPSTPADPTTADTPDPTSAAGDPGADATDDEPDTGPAPGEQLAADSTPPATA